MCFYFRQSGAALTVYSLPLRKLNSSEIEDGQFSRRLDPSFTPGALSVSDRREDEFAKQRLVAADRRS